MNEKDKKEIEIEHRRMYLSKLYRVDLDRYLRSELIQLAKGIVPNCWSLTRKELIEGIIYYTTDLRD